MQEQSGHLKYESIDIFLSLFIHIIYIHIFIYVFIYIIYTHTYKYINEHINDKDGISVDLQINH